MADVVAIFGAARALPGRSCSFDLAPTLMDIDLAGLNRIRASQWSQDDDRGVLMGAFLAEADEEGAENTPAKTFMADMCALIDAGVDGVCWRVSVEIADAEAWIAKYRPELATQAAMRP
jgi:hypothetical protein